MSASPYQYGCEDGYTDAKGGRAYVDVDLTDPEYCRGYENGVDNRQRFEAAANSPEVPE